MPGVSLNVSYEVRLESSFDQQSIWARCAVMILIVIAAARRLTGLQLEQGGGIRILLGMTLLALVIFGVVRAFRQKDRSRAVDVLILISACVLGFWTLLGSAMLSLLEVRTVPSRALERTHPQQLPLDTFVNFGVRDCSSAFDGSCGTTQAQFFPVRDDKSHIVVMIKAGTRMTFHATTELLRTSGVHHVKMMLAEPFQVFRVADNASMSASVTTDADLKYEVQLGDSRIRVQDLHLAMGTLSPCGIDKLHLDESTFRHDGREVLVPERGRITLILDIEVARFV